MNKEINFQNELRKLLTQSQNIHRVAQQYFEQATQIISNNEIFLNNLEKRKREVELVIHLCQEQMQAANSLLQQVKRTYNELAARVDTLCSSYLKTMRDLQTVFIKLREKNVEDCFCENIQDIDSKTRTHTLFDWVPIEEVHKMQSEAYSEMAAMQKLALYLRMTGCKLERKYDHISQISKFLIKDYVTPIKFDKQSLQKREFATINSIVLTIAAHCDRLDHLISSPKNSSIDISTYSEATRGLLENLEHIRDCLDRLNNVTQEVDDCNQIFNGAYQQANQLNELLNFFGTECNKKSRGLTHYETMYHEHCDGYKHLFEELVRLGYFYNCFLVAYDKMIFEISRRRSVLDKQQGLVDRFQRELDLLYRNEVLERDRFLQEFGDFLPPNMCLALNEPMPNRHIYPEVVVSQLPVCSEQPRRPTTEVEIAPTDSQGIEVSSPTSPRGTRPSSPSMAQEAGSPIVLEHRKNSWDGWSGEAVEFKGVERSQKDLNKATMGGEAGGKRI